SLSRPPHDPVPIVERVHLATAAVVDDDAVAGSVDCLGDTGRQCAPIGATSATVVSGLVSGPLDFSGRIPIWGTGHFKLQIFSKSATVAAVGVLALCRYVLAGWL